jgi:hypothetical protein
MPTPSQSISEPAISSPAPVAAQLPTFANLNDAEQEAIKRYPDLGVKGSQLNMEFLALYNQLKQDQPESFHIFSWPVMLARQAYKLIGTSVEIQQADNVYLCGVTFKEPLPPSDEVDALVREYLDQAISQHRGTDIIANASSQDGQPLRDNSTPGAYEYSGGLIYRAATGVIETQADEDRASGKTINHAERTDYSVDVERNQGLTGNKYIMLYLVFPNPPSITDAEADLIAEIKNLPERDSDIMAFIMIGDKDTRSSWTQMPDPDGGNFGADYDPSTQTITTGNISHPRLVVPLHG